MHNCLLLTQLPDFKLYYSLQDCNSHIMYVQCILLNTIQFKNAIKFDAVALALAGVQTRSRGILTDPLPNRQPCPDSLWQTRPCRGGYCPTYSWHTYYWFGARRAVWCQRSDGMAVIGEWRNDRTPWLS